MTTIGRIAATMFLPSIPAHAAVIDWVASRDLLANESQLTDAVNPNSTVPQWSYGYRSVLADSGLTLYSTLEHNNNVAGGQLQGFTSSNDLGLVVNTSGSNVVLDYGFGPLEPILPGQIITGPGSSNQYSILRWTAPSAGSYDVSAFWNDIDPHGGDGISGHIVVNGVAVFNQSALNDGADITYSSRLSLAAGATVDFALGANSGNPFDTTIIDATITPVPEPSSALVLTAGVALCVARRRKG